MVYGRGSAQADRFWAADAPAPRAAKAFDAADRWPPNIDRGAPQVIVMPLANRSKTIDPEARAERVISFGTFRLIPAQQLLLEGDTPVRLGSRALEILIMLVERAGELVSKSELLSRVWPGTFVDENTLRVHIAGLRKALGDGQPGRRYVTNITGRGYRFVAPVDLSESGDRPVPKSTAAQRTNNLSISQVRALGRGNAIGALLDQLSKQRLITIVGAGGIGKTTVAVAVAETLLQTYEDGVWFVDLATLSDACQVPGAIASALGLAVEREYAVSRLTDLLRHKTMLLVLDSCEHVVDAAATMAEQLLSGAPGVRILATSREPLRADGERVHRLSPLEIPPDPAGLSACAAIAYSSVQLFVERAAACVDGFQLSDADASIVIDICHKLGGMPLAIELAAARVDAFGLGQLAVLLDDRFRILNQGRRTAQPRHRSLDAALDWSYEFLPEAERALLRRLSVFTNAFTLMDAVAALAGGDSTDMMDGIANLVAKSLISADAGGAVVQYRLLDTTRAYAQRKLIESDELQRLSTAT